jgi:hypothetical protein
VRALSPSMVPGVREAQEAVDYVGVNYGTEASAVPCNHAVGLYDPVEGTLKLLPLGGDRVIRMMPRVRRRPPWVHLEWNRAPLGSGSNCCRSGETSSSA